MLGLLLPLLIVVAGFASVSGEREHGTLPLLLSQGATPGQILAGKALGIGVAASAAAIPLGLVVAAFLVFGGGDSPSMLRVAALVATYGAYLAGWVLMTVWISSRRRSSGAALAHLVALWVVLGVALPRLGASVAAALHPAPSRAQFSLWTKSRGIRATMHPAWPPPGELARPSLRSGALFVAHRSEYTRYSSLARLVIRAPPPPGELGHSRCSRDFIHRLNSSPGCRRPRNRSAKAITPTIPSSTPCATSI